jgi:competence protein ComEC
MTKSKIFLILCLSFVAGIFCGQFLNYETMALLAMVFIMLVTIGWQKKKLIVVGLAGLVLLAGAIRFRVDYTQNDLAPFYGQKLSVIGVISEEPDIRSEKTYLTLNNLEINNQHLKSKLLISVNNFPEYQYGQKLKLEAKIQEPKEYDDFSYKNYLSRYGVDAVSYQPKIELIQGNFGFKPKVYILKFKKYFTGNLSRILPEPQNAFLGGLILGAKHSLPDWLTEQFSRTGTSHIVAISGYNITIIAYGLDKALQRFKKKISFSVSLISISVFVIATGASASVVRAGIMGALVLIALNVGRVYAISNALAFTAAMMLVISPQVLTFDVGFQLSFVALLGLIYFTPIIEPYFWRLPKILREVFVATLSAQIFTLPILMFNFGKLSIIAPIVNVLVLPLVPLTMLMGFLGGVLALVWDKLALPFAWAAWVLLTYIMRVVGFFSSLPLAQVSGRMNGVICIIYYLILISSVISYYQFERVSNLWYLWKAKLKNSFGF